MTGTYILVSAKAYELKAELGGGYRAVAENTMTGETLRGDVQRDWDAARNEAIRFANKLLAGARVAPGYYRNRKGSWRCNYWAEA